MVVVDIGYHKIVLTKEKAMILVEALEAAETYEAKYWNTDKRKELGMTEDYTYHVYPTKSQFGMHIITDTHYQMAKLAGAPSKD